MSNVNCCYRRDCTLFSLIAAVILGVLGAFLQITGVIAVATVFLWVALGIGVVYLAILPITLSRIPRGDAKYCLCRPLNAILIGLLGTIFLAALLLQIGIVATSVISAILVGLLIAALTLIFTGTACLVRCLANCNE